MLTATWEYRKPDLALSVVSRGLFLAKQQSYEIWDLREKIVCLFLMGIITTAGISKLMYVLSQQGLYFWCAAYSL